jgi:hypothetical protein
MARVETGSLIDQLARDWQILKPLKKGDKRVDFAAKTFTTAMQQMLSSCPARLKAADSDLEQLWAAVMVLAGDARKIAT